ncbi:hypothetical protein [Sporosarcina sp. FSL K6-3508]|uniref:hypothetical protein n=1 Tax=Sporosarcina sp. FSL K6-3508 TaxID=2921557 RepID=UPI00315A47AD
MSLFINNDKHKSIYKNQEKIKGINQNFFRSDPLSEILKEQQKINDSFYRSIRDLETISKQQKFRQNEQWDEINHLFNEFKEYHDRKNKHVVQKLLDLEAGNRKLRQRFNHKQLSEEKWIDQMDSIQKSNDEIILQLIQYALTSEQIEEKVDEQITTQKQMYEKVLEHSKNQTDVIKRLEIQEEISEKTLIQIDHFRSVELKGQFDELKELYGKHEKTEQKLLDLVTENRKLEQQFINKQLPAQEWIDNMIFIRKSTDEIMEQLQQYALRSEQIERKLEEEIIAQKQTNEQVLEQVNKQTDDIRRLENKKGITERALRQIRTYSDEQALEGIKRLPTDNKSVAKKINTGNVQLHKPKPKSEPELKKGNSNLLRHINKKNVRLIKLEECPLKEVNYQQLECELKNQTEGSEREGNEAEKLSSQKNECQRAEENRKASLRRKKVFGKREQNKGSLQKYYLYKQFSKYPRIDDF